MKSHGLEMEGQIYALNKPITFISKTGYNSQFVVIDGILYSTTGTTATISNYTTGRGTTNQNPFFGFDNFKQVPIPSTSPIVEVGGGYNCYAYALLEDGSLYTWGQNNYGTCGLGNTTITPIPTSAAANVTNVYSHATNGGYGYANRLFIKKTDGYIYGCGYNGYGQLGLNDTTQRDEFNQITALGTTVESLWNMSSAYGCTVAQKADKSLWVCGNNTNGQLGNSDTGHLDEFTDVTSAWCTGGDTTLIRVIISTINSATSMGMLFDDGSDTLLRMSGYNVHGQLGDTTTTQRTAPVTPNVGTGRIAKIAGLGGYLTVNCLKEDGNLYAWGYNGYGQAGNGTATSFSTPANVQTDVEDIFSDGIDEYHTSYGHHNQSFIRKTDKQLYACGHNGHAACGLGHATTPITTHTRVLMPYNEEVVDIGWFTSTGSVRTILARTVSNKLYAWGYNGQNNITDSGVGYVYVPTNIKIPNWNNI